MTSPFVTQAVGILLLGGALLTPKEHREARVNVSEVSPLKTHSKTAS